MIIKAMTNTTCSHFIGGIPNTSSKFYLFDILCLTSQNLLASLSLAELPIMSARKDFQIMSTDQDYRYKPSARFSLAGILITSFPLHIESKSHRHKTPARYSLARFLIAPFPLNIECKGHRQKTPARFLIFGEFPITMITSYMHHAYNCLRHLPLRIAWLSTE